MTKNKEMIDRILDRFNGKIYLIPGNHEGAVNGYHKKFQWIKDYYELKVPDPDCDNGAQRIILFH